MKNIVYPLLIFIHINLSGQNIKIVEIKFSTTVPRSGFTEEIAITKDSVRIHEFSKRSPENVRILKATKSTIWPELENEVKNLDFENLYNLKSPTQKRFPDGAKISQLLFTDSNSNTYEHSFDNELPNAQLTTILNLLIKLKE